MEKEKGKPQIRFKGFHDPWEQRKLSEMCGTFEYGLNAAAKEFDGKNKYIRITDIDDASREFLLSDLSSPDICLDSMSKYLLSSGDIVFARTGASVGKTYIYRENDGIVYFAGFLIRAKVNQDNDAEFVFQSTLSPSYEKYIRITSQRSGQPGVNAQEYGEYDLFAPSKEEQQRIGQFLRGIDNLITLHQRKCDKLTNVKKSMLEKMFPKNGSNVPEIRFKGFTDPWEQRKLGECFSERVESMPDGELISVTINDGIKKFSELGRQDNSNDDKSKYKKVCVGDIAYNSMRMWQGASGYSPYEGIVSPAYTVLSPNAEVFSRCIAYQFKLPQMIHTFQINSQGITSDNWNLKYPALSEIKVYISKSVAEQKQIAEFFADIDNLITLHQRELEKLKKLKKACLGKMFV